MQDSVTDAGLPEEQGLDQSQLYRWSKSRIQPLLDAMASATDDDEFVEYAESCRQRTFYLLEQGQSPLQLTRLIADLNDGLTQRMVELKLAPASEQGVRWCWLSLGSQGRREQTFHTDQDNGIIFRPPPTMSEDQCKALLLPLCQEINQLLDRCGFPLCPGNIMAGNPKWCLSAEQWQACFHNWISSGDPKAVLHGAIFFDFRPLHGDLTLADELSAYLLAEAGRSAIFMRLMASNALSRTPPFTWWGGLKTQTIEQRKGLFDIKLNGVSLFTDAARVLGLAQGVAQCNTETRLFQAGPKLGISDTRLRSWTSAFQHLQGVRLLHQANQHRRGEAMDNHIVISQLPEFHREVLKLALVQAKWLQKRVSMEYLLG